MPREPTEDALAAVFRCCPSQR